MELTEIDRTSNNHFASLHLVLCAEDALGVDAKVGLLGHRQRLGVVVVELQGVRGEVV